MKKKVAVTQVVEIEIDEKEFTEEFMREFRESFYDLNSIDDHIEYLAQLYAYGAASNGSFIEGYGDQMNIKGKVIDTSAEFED